MSMNSRRRFLRQAAGASLLSLSDAPLVSGLGRVTANDAQVDSSIVRFQPEIEPLVRLIEETPRNQLIEVMARHVRDGLSYQRVLAALMLAGVRNVQPRPSVGFKFHAVLVVNSAHLASLSSPDADRWLPIFWAIDHFKGSQARDVSEGDWTMGAVDESSVPSSTRAESAFRQAMDRWDESAADAAVVGLVRSTGAHQLFELFARYGARDFRSIGHKAIFVANGFRTLDCIGYRYAEPVLRSLAYALLNHRDEPNPADSDLEADRPWRENRARVARFRADWRDGQVDAEATRALLASIRTDQTSEACELSVELINRGVAPQSLFDAMFLAAGEMLMRQPGIVALHASTTTNAMHYAFQTCINDDTRRMLMLQNVAFLTMFREAMKRRGDVGDARIDMLARESIEQDQAGIEPIMHEVSTNPGRAARMVLTNLDTGQRPEQLIRAARQMIFLKGTDSHDYKFSSAVLEDYYQISPAWRDRFLAASVFKLRGAGDADNGLVDRIRDALA